MCPVYDWKCETCEIAVEVQHKMADSNVPPTTDDAVQCMCESPRWKRVMTAPHVVGKAAYLDGQRKFHGAREAAKLKRESRMSKDATKKTEISKEIRKLGIKQYDN